MPAKKSRPTTHRPMHPRCNFQFADGRRCRMLRHPHLELCLFHNRELEQLRSTQQIAAELLALGGNFRNPIALNFVLGKLFSHVATGRMHRRQASTLAYIAQLLLQTLDTKRYNLARDYHDYAALIPTLDAPYPSGDGCVAPPSSAASSSSPSGSRAASPSDHSHESVRSTQLPPSPAIVADRLIHPNPNAHQPPEPHARL
jgi:hypothetical protein